MPRMRSALSRGAREVWNWLREWSGDSAYEQYVRRASSRPCAHRLLSRDEFYVEQLERQYSQPTRCC